MKQLSTSVLQFFLPALLLLGTTIAPSLHAQERPKLCDTDSLIVSTGWDRLKDTLEIFKDQDPYWEVVKIVANPMPTSLGEWQATISIPAPISSSECQWIHPFDTKSWPSGTCTFQTEICLTEIAANGRLVCEVLAHAHARVLLNETVIGETALSGSGRYDPLQIDADVTPYLKLGLNRLQVEITTPEGESERERLRRGFALAGYITAQSEATTTPFSCDACGQVLPSTR